MSEIEQNRQLRRSYSTYTDNSNILKDTTARQVDQIRRDDDMIKTPKCTIIDIDFAMMSYLKEIIQPQIVENNKVIDVPIFYTNGEKWAQYQKRGYILDDRGKALTPYIGLRRTTISDRLPMLGVNHSPAGFQLTHGNRFSLKNRYDRFSVQLGTTPRREYYISNVPEFITVSYDLLIWAEYIDQMNDIIEQIMPMNGYAWGTTWKFPTSISDYTFDTVNTTGEDRLVRASMPLTVQATMLRSSELRVANLRKMYSVKKITFGNETDSIELYENKPAGPTNTYDLTNQPYADNLQNLTLNIKVDNSNKKKTN